MAFTALQKAECAQRELRQRRRVYARLVADNRMSQQKANAEIAIMEEIASDYAKLAREEAPGLPL